MTSLVTEQFRAPADRREARAYEWARRQTIDELAGRTVWCAIPQLRARLEWAVPSGVAAIALDVPQHYDNADTVVPDVRADDVVVLSSRPTAALARAIRDRGAHALWLMDAPHDRAEGIDAYLLTGSTAHGALIVAAVMPSAGIVAVKELSGDPYRDVGWSRMLADVVHTDREECVGGTLHPCPTVAVR